MTVFPRLGPPLRSSLLSSLRCDTRCEAHEGPRLMTLPLIFEPPRRGLPPRHLADLGEAERRAAVAELGLPAYRADQLSRHYFGRLQTDAATMTDLPPAARARLGDALLPPLLTEVRHLQTDAGTTRRSEEHTSELQSRPHLVCRL